MIYIFLKIYLQKNNLNIAKVIFRDVVGCSIRVYNFILPNSSIKIFFTLNIPNNGELLTS